MPREIDDAWIEEAIAAYRRIEEKQASSSPRHYRAWRPPFALLMSSIEVIVGADGAVRRVTVLGSLQTMSNTELSRSIQQATSAAHEAAEWARRKLYDETFGEYDSLRRAYENPSKLARRLESAADELARMRCELADDGPNSSPRPRPRPRS